MLYCDGDIFSKICTVQIKIHIHCTLLHKKLTSSTVTCIEVNIISLLWNRHL